ncbi:diacylglycerol/lipid kinase family protein [Haladaptatus pallidirubidus]|uniref:Diacylglycerol kinase family lipid kinase n=1 Tax=Haladaptatus pallidirubidus TaxID=1008152 RepID=A0AAV3UNM2_9EURY|nr:diacylglycerol kinase family protein [Haladaptatus pallidirubidus]
MTGNDQETSDTLCLNATNHWLILNPTSGTADHRDTIRQRGAQHGYTIRETKHEGHAVSLTKEAVGNGVEVLAVAGGDGTLHEVVQGLAEVDALDSVTLGVLPVGTKNIFATNIGITNLEQGFEVLKTGKRRSIDIGFADDEPFVLSCIAGLTAEASLATSSELKERFGSLGFIIAGIREATEFESLHLNLTAVLDEKEATWSGDALCVLIGNTRRFAKEGGQANVEDGLFEVVIIEQMPPTDIAAEAMSHRLLGEDTEHVHHLKAHQVEVRRLDREPIRFSIDGEQQTHDELLLRTHPQVLTVCIGSTYTPAPRE